MNKCYGVITFWRCLAGLGLGWGSNSSHHLYSYDINIFSSLIILGYLIGLSINLSIGELGPTILNVNDGVYCLSFINCVPRELKASFNVAISVLFHDVTLCVQLCTKLGLVYLP
jgi:hypothetical protein